MIHISTFSGIGGFDLAAEWMGWNNYVSCDINEFGNRVREYYWPEAYHHRDIKTLTYETINAELSRRFGKDWRNQDIILTGGFPCQPFSVAGKQLGTEDDRHLWPEMLRVIREVGPRWIVGENVRGLVNWSGGLVFDQVQADLEAEGYEVLPFMVPDCAVNAPHRRDRVWFVAYRPNAGDEGVREPEISANKLRPTADTGKQRCDDGGNNREERHISRNVNGDAKKNKSERDGRVGGAGSIGETTKNPIGSGRLYGEHEQDGGRPDTAKTGEGVDDRPERHGSDEVIADATSDRFKGRSNSGELRSEGEGREQRLTNLGGFSRADWQDFPTQPPVCNGDDGLSARLDGITFSKWRQESIKAGGNAVVPQVVFQIFKAIENYG